MEEDEANGSDVLSTDEFDSKDVSDGEFDSDFDSAAEEELEEETEDSFSILEGEAGELHDPKRDAITAITKRQPVFIVMK